MNLHAVLGGWGAGEPPAAGCGGPPLPPTRRYRRRRRVAYAYVGEGAGHAVWRVHGRVGGRNQPRRVDVPRARQAAGYAGLRCAGRGWSTRRPSCSAWLRRLRSGGSPPNSLKGGRAATGARRRARAVPPGGPRAAHAPPCAPPPRRRYMRANRHSRPLPPLPSLCPPSPAGAQSGQCAVPAAARAMRSAARRSLFPALVGGVPRPPARRRQGAGLGVGPALAGSLAGVAHPAGGPARL